MANLVNRHKNMGKSSPTSKLKLENADETSNIQSNESNVEERGEDIQTSVQTTLFCYECSSGNPPDSAENTKEFQNFVDNVFHDPHETYAVASTVKKTKASTPRCLSKESSEVRDGDFMFAYQAGVPSLLLQNKDIEIGIRGMFPVAKKKNSQHPSLSSKIREALRQTKEASGATKNIFDYVFVNTSQTILAERANICTENWEANEAWKYCEEKVRSKAELDNFFGE